MLISLLIFILPLVAIAILTYQGYQAAAGAGRNRIGWAFTVFGTGLILVLMLPGILGLILGLIFAVVGAADILGEYFTGIFIVMWVVAVVASLAAMMFLVGKAGMMIEDGDETAVPPPPTFI